MEQVNYTVNILRTHAKRLEDEVGDLKDREASSHKMWQEVGNKLTEKQNQLRSVHQSIVLLEEVL